MRTSTPRLRSTGALLTLLVSVAALGTFTGATPAQAATALGTVTFDPATGQDITPITLTTVSSGATKGCPADSPNVGGKVTGPGGWAAGINAITNSDAGVSSTSEFSVPMQDTFISLATTNGLTVIPGKYTITMYCQDILGVTPSGEFSSSLWFTDSTHYQSTDPAGPAQATPTTTTLSATPATGAVAGDEVTLVAAVSPTAATGSVQFTDTIGGSTVNVGTPVTVSGGSASLATTALSAATHSLKAIFSPADATAYQVSTSAELSYLVGGSSTQPQTPVLTLGPATQSVVEGAAAEFTLSLDLTAAAGQVQLSDTVGGTTSALGTPVALTNGTGTFSTNALAVGSHSVTATFTPTDAGAYTAATSTAVTVTVTAAPTGSTDTTTNLAASPAATVVAGNPVTFTAAVAPAEATGTVRFTAKSSTATDAVELGVPTVTAGVATVTTSSLAVGSYEILAVFTPTDPAAYDPSTSATLAYTVTAGENPQAVSTRTNLTGWSTGWCPTEDSKPVTTTAEVNGRSGGWHRRRCRGELLVARVRPQTAAGAVQFTDTVKGAVATPIEAPVTVSNGWAVLFVEVSSGRHSYAATFVPDDPAAYAPSTSNRLRLDTHPRPRHHRR